jgi:uncharacterized OsmC-like protein/TusA-related sulfurtransferase
MTREASTGDAVPPPDARVDGGDLDCGSGLLLIIRSAMAPLPAGGVLEVTSRERSVREDLPAWCRMVGHQLLAVGDRGGEGQSYLLRKKAADPALAQDLERAQQHVWQVRTRWTSGMQSKVAVRNHAFAVGQPASFDTVDEAPSAVEYLLAALAGAVAAGLQWRLSRQGVEVRHLEVVAKGRAGDMLVFLDVAQDGDPGLRALELSVFVDADIEQPQLDALLAETLRRCPVTRTLQRGTTVSATAKVT